ncbi:MAG: sulfatase family protein, partial [Solirubrobacterales bacterium]
MAALLSALVIAACEDEQNADPVTTKQAEAERSAEEVEPTGPEIAPVADAKRPNVVVVYTDDQDTGSVSVMPNVSRLIAEQGTTFTRAYASTPQCCPSRASFLTGQYAHNHGVLDNIPPRGGFEALDGERTLPVWLEGDGYRTSWLGRYLNQYGSPASSRPPTEVPPGWTDWHVPVNRTEFQMYDYELNENGELRRYGAAPEDYLTDVLAEKARAFVAKSADAGKPFFLVVAPLAPHGEGVLEAIKDPPRDPRPAPRHDGRFDARELPRPESFNEPDISDKPPFIAKRPQMSPRALKKLTRSHRSRLESLLAVDDLVGGVVDELETQDVLDDTIFIYTSDQGYLLGEHRLKGKERPYEGAVRVPLIVRGPGFPAGESRLQQAVSVDLAHTILAAAGVQPDLPLDGIDLRQIAGDP